MTLSCSLSLEKVLMDRFVVPISAIILMIYSSVVSSFLLIILQIFAQYPNEQVRQDNRYMQLCYSDTCNKTYNISGMPGLHNTTAVFHSLTCIPWVDMLNFCYSNRFNYVGKNPLVTFMPWKNWRRLICLWGVR